MRIKRYKNNKKGGDRMSRYAIPRLELISAASFLNINIHESMYFDKFFYQDEIIIKGSRFICTLMHCDSIESARFAIDIIQKKYKDATHNCYAFQVNEPKSTLHIGYSDDGEPHGTAGKPMLSQLLHADVGEIAAVVTRYFGGIKLGTGGLVRAYQESVQKALESLPRQEKIEKVEVQIILDYSHQGFLHRMLEDFELNIVHEDFQADITYTLALPEDRRADFLLELQAVTEGTFILL